MNNQFEMKIEDIFNIGKHTVFVGKVKGQQSRIKRCECFLSVGGEVVERFMIEDEDLFLRETRSLRTLQKTIVDKNTIQNGECKLVCSNSQARQQRDAKQETESAR